MGPEKIEREIIELLQGASELGKRASESLGDLSVYSVEVSRRFEAFAKDLKKFESELLKQSEQTEKLKAMVEKNRTNFLEIMNSAKDNDARRYSATLLFLSSSISAILSAIATIIASNK